MPGGTHSRELFPSTWTLGPAVWKNRDYVLLFPLLSFIRNIWKHKWWHGDVVVCAVASKGEGCGVRPAGRVGLCCVFAGTLGACVVLFWVLWFPSTIQIQVFSVNWWFWIVWTTGSGCVWTHSVSVMFPLLSTASSNKLSPFRTSMVNFIIITKTFNIYFFII